MSELYVDFAPVLNGVALTQSHSVQGQQNLSIMELVNSGELQPLGYREAFNEPNLAIETFNLFQVLDAGELNISLSEGLNATTGNTISQFRKALDGGGFNTGSVHGQAVSPRSFISVESIRAEQDSNVPASCRLNAHLLRSGTTNPNIVGNTAALLGTLSLGTIYALGPCYINDVKFAGLQSVEYLTGLQAKPKRESGELFAERIRITKLKHELRLGVEDLSTLTAQGFGLSAAAGVVDQYFRKIDPVGGRVDDTTAEHMKISFSTSQFLMQEIRPSGENSEVQTVPTLLNTGTVSLDMASTIP